MKKELTYIDSDQACKIVALLALIVGSIVGFLVGILALIKGDQSGWLVMFLTPLFYSLKTAVGTAISIWLYNAAVRWLGKGIVFHFIDSE